MTPIKVGDRVRDCDPRMNGREGTVTGFEFRSSRYPMPGSLRYQHHEVAVVQYGNRQTVVRLDRIHDSPARRSGWARVAP